MQDDDYDRYLEEDEPWFECPLCKEVDKHGPMPCRRVRRSIADGKLKEDAWAQARKKGYDLEAT